MKNTNFYPSIWQTIPYSLEMADHLSAQGKRPVDLTLKNSYAIQHEIAAMNLNIIGLSVLDNNRTEHPVTEFPEQTMLNLFGKRSGYFIKTKRALSLKPGTYTTFRFYLAEKGNSFKFTDKSTQDIYGFDFLDFEIQNGFKVDNNYSSPVLLRFDLESFKTTSIIKTIQAYFKNVIKTAQDGSFAN